MTDKEDDIVMAEQDADASHDHDDDQLPANRFELELEFIQCLASPAYLHHLATTGILVEPPFLEFLEYLQYWKKPEYARLIQYPHCLFFLDLLINNAVFRRELANISFRNFIHEQQFYSWQYRAKNLYGQGLTPVENDDNETTEPPDEESPELQQQEQGQV